MKINWKQKLSSRKFWVALVGFISALLFVFKVAESDITQITGVIMSGATLIAYILAEGYADGNRTVEQYIVEEKQVTNAIGFVVDNDEE